MNCKHLLKWPRMKKPKTPKNTMSIDYASHAKVKIQGWQTQFDDVPENAPSTQVIIGLDFGTAYTKVVISGAGQKYGVPLNDSEQGTNKYLLPTRLYEDSAGNLTVLQPEIFLHTHTNFKMRILDNELDDNIKKHITIYIAWILKKSRYWLMTEKHSVFGNTQLKWAVNIGLPTASHANKRLQKIYQDIVKVAWSESTNQHINNKNSGKKNNPERELHSDLIEALPEFAAQIHGYISSPQRKRGIHTLVDVGAGTIDATVFIVHKDQDGQNRHPILADSVKKLGTIYLTEHRCTWSGECKGWKPGLQDVFPSDEEFSQKLGVTREDLDSIDKEFTSKIVKQISPLLQHAYQDKTDPLYQKEWKTGIPMMLCGGGARIEFYQNCYFKEVMDKLKPTAHGRSLHESHRPEIRNLDAPNLLGEDGDRLSVAYGLSFDASEIGKITRPQPISSSNSENAHIRKSACPNCSGAGRLYSYCPRCGGSGFV